MAGLSAFAKANPQKNVEVDSTSTHISLIPSRPTRMLLDPLNTLPRHRGGRVSLPVSSLRTGCQPTPQTHPAGMIPVYSQAPTLESRPTAWHLSPINTRRGFTLRIDTSLETLGEPTAEETCLSADSELQGVINMYGSALYDPTQDDVVTADGRQHERMGKRPAPAEVEADICRARARKLRHGRSFVAPGKDEPIQAFERVPAAPVTTHTPQLPDPFPHAQPSSPFAGNSNDDDDDRMNVSGFEDNDDGDEDHSMAGDSDKENDHGMAVDEPRSSSGRRAVLEVSVLREPMPFASHGVHHDAAPFAEHFRIAHAPRSPSHSSIEDEHDAIRLVRLEEDFAAHPVGAGRVEDMQYNLSTGGVLF